jgi:Helicase associated domain
LSAWVAKQRKNYRIKKKDQPSVLSDDKEKRLLDIGFVFDTSDPNFKFVTSGCRRLKDDWDTMFQELKAYIEEHGTMDGLPRRANAEWPLLGWIYKQRAQYRKLIGGAPCRLTEERLALLRSINFDFSFTKNSFRQLPGWMEKVMPKKRFSREMIKMGAARRKEYLARMQEDESRSCTVAEAADGKNTDGAADSEGQHDVVAVPAVLIAKKARSKAFIGVTPLGV